MGKIIKKRNSCLKFVNNHKTKVYHICRYSEHIVNKEIVDVMQQLAPIYQELDNDFQTIDVVDLIYYERWLKNGRYKKGRIILCRP